MIILRTIGYEGTTIDQFVDALLDAGVGALLDVRAVPISRKPGFSKTALAKKIENSGIRYTHIPALGNPKTGRDAAKRGDRAEFERIFHARLLVDHVQSALYAAVGVTRILSTCLLCFEKNHEDCHRTIVASAMSAIAPMEISHIDICRTRPAARHVRATKELLL